MKVSQPPSLHLYAHLKHANTRALNPNPTYPPPSIYSKRIPYFAAKDLTILVKKLVKVGLNPIIYCGVKKSEYPVLAEITLSGSALKNPLTASPRLG